MFNTITMPDPVFLMALYNERIRTGKMSLHPWQQEVLFQYARKDLDYTKQVNRMNLVAANGSGKSQMVVAPAAAWTAMAYDQSRTVITSSSGKQLDGQTGRAIRHVCEQVNALSRDINRGISNIANIHTVQIRIVLTFTARSKCLRRMSQEKRKVTTRT